MAKQAEGNVVYCQEKGNPYLKSVLCEISRVISGKRTLYLSGRYWRVKQRNRAKRAAIALARKLLTLIYTMLKTGTPYNEDCFEQRRKRCERKRAHRMVNFLAPGVFCICSVDLGIFGFGLFLPVIVLPLCGVVESIFYLRPCMVSKALQASSENM